MPPKFGTPKKHKFRPSSETFATIRALEKLVSDDDPWKESLTSQLGAVHSTIEKLQDLQRSDSFLSVIPTRTPEKLHAFQKWLTAKHGIDLEGLGLKLAFVSNDAQNATFFATRKIPVGELLLKVESPLILTSILAQHGSNLTKLANRLPEITPYHSLTLVLCLLAEALNPTSPYAPYIAILPAMHTMPLSLFDANETLALAPSNARDIVIKSLRALIRDYTRIFQITSRLCPNEPLFQALSFSNWRWAHSIAMSRQNSIPIPPGWRTQVSEKIPVGETCMACVPVWDMFNHETGDMTTSVVMTQDDVSVECFAMRTFEPGEAVTMCYGKRCNLELALYSGFVDNSNIYDKLSFNIPLTNSVPFAPVKARLLLKKGFDVKEEPTKGGWICASDIVVGNECVDKALTIATIAMMDKNAISTFLRADETSVPLVVTLDALELVESLLLDKLSLYNSENEDSSKGEISSQARTFIHNLHRSETSLLTNAVNVVRQRREMFVPNSE